MVLLLFSVSLLIIIVFLYLKKITEKKKDVRGKIALVTGGGNGLGKGLCMQLAKHRCDIVIADIDFEAAKISAEEIKNQFGVRCKAYKVDVTNYEDIQALKKNVTLEFGHVDILINNAGLISYASILQESDTFIEKMVKVNLTGAILMTKCFLENMIEKKSGHIVSISSLGGLYHIPYAVNYCATKFGLTGFMMGLREFMRIEKMDKNIFLSIIFPDVIATRDHVINSVSDRFVVFSSNLIKISTAFFFQLQYFISESRS